MFGIYWRNGLKWVYSGKSFMYDKEGRHNGHHTVHLSPTAWAQCDFPELRYSGQWRAVKLAG